MRNAFNTAVQGVKDTVNGVGFDHPFSIINALVTGWNGYNVGRALYFGGVGMVSPISALFLGLCIAGHWYDGRQRRLAGYEPRWWP